MNIRRWIFDHLKLIKVQNLTRPSPATAIDDKFRACAYRVVAVADEWRLNTLAEYGKKWGSHDGLETAIMEARILDLKYKNAIEICVAEVTTYLIEPPADHDACGAKYLLLEEIVWSNRRQIGVTNDH